MPIDRRRLMVGAAGLGLPTLLASAAPAAIAQSSARTWLRLVADLSEEPMVAVTRGDVWGFKPQADDLTPEAFAKRLYGYWSLAVRQARNRPDGGVVLSTKAWSFYLDPQSGAVVDHIANPYKGTVVSCPPLSGPVSTALYPADGAPDAHAGAALGLTDRRMGERAWVGVNRISRFKPSDTTWFKLEADLTSYACKAADLDNGALTHVPNSWSHNLVAEWQTWMRMHGDPGHILFKGDGAFVPGLQQAPPELLAAIDAHFPGTMPPIAAWRR